MAESPKSPSCPTCKYDLRAQVQPPVPSMVRCPECGMQIRSVDLFRPDEISRAAIIALVLLPLPAATFGLWLLALILGNRGLFAIPMLLPFIVPLIALIHVAWMHSRLTRQSAIQFPPFVFALLFIYDIVIGFGSVCAGLLIVRTG